MKKLVMIIVMVLMVVLCAPTTVGAAEKTVNVKSVRIDKKNVVLPVWKSAKLTKIITPKNATNKRVRWYCTNPDVIRLTQRGYVVSKKPGRSMVVVETQDGRKAASCMITVLPVTASGRKVKYNAKDYLIKLG